MRDCQNVEIREMLPEQAADSLQGDFARRVTDHLHECADCAAELTVLRSARAVLLRPPAVDVSRIAAGVASATRSRAGAPSPDARRRAGLRAAAAILVMAAGATSLALWTDRSASSPGAGAAIAQGQLPARDGLALTAGLADLSDAEVEALIEDIDVLDTDYGPEPDATLPALALGELGGA